MDLENMVKKYIITAAQYGALPNNEFLDSLEKYAKVNDIDKITILPMQGKTVDDDTLHERFTNNNYYEVVTDNKKLNKYVMINKFTVLPQQILPLTGLSRFAQDDKSSIFAAPKQQLQVIPNSQTDMPKVMMTTGACTNPDYRDNRIGQIAKRDHVFGAIVVETEGNKWFHYRQIRAQKNGLFYDLGTKYDGSKKPKMTRPEALVLGDIHVGDLDKKAYEASWDMISTYNPKRVILHDVFNGRSISHHEDGKLVEKAQSYKVNCLSLEKELEMTARFLTELSINFPSTDFYVVKSNHDLFLYRYLTETRFIKEPQNALIGAKLLAKAIEGYDPLKEGLNLTYELPSNLHFLSEDDDLKVRGYQLAAHGHRGMNGTRGSPRAMETAYGKSITAHGHSPFIFRNTVRVGTLTKLKLDYNKGPSSWLQSNCFLYENGSPQLINILKGKYKV